MAPNWQDCSTGQRLSGGAPRRPRQQILVHHLKDSQCTPMQHHATHQLSRRRPQRQTRRQPRQRKNLSARTGARKIIKLVQHFHPRNVHRGSVALAPNVHLMPRPRPQRRQPRQRKNLSAGTGARKIIKRVQHFHPRNAHRGSVALAPSVQQAHPR